tara:strand:+ start:137 stop:1012 length:876 start_codon:yes stop_codon:yes gene_type:complete
MNKDDSEFDLDIENYDLDDLLDLFNLKPQFTQSDLKIARRKVMETHPDKSSLPGEYFQFFTKAYNNLESVFRFRTQGEKNLRRKRKDANEIVEDTREIADALTQDNNFSKKFNQLFEKNVGCSYKKGGYDEWYKTSESDNKTMKCSNRSQMNKLIFDKKKELRSLVVHQEVKAIGCEGIDDIDGNAPTGFQSALFSDLQYDDLKHAHEESVIPVTMDDMVDRPSTVHAMQQSRGTGIVPLSKQDSESILAKQHETSSISAAYRAHRLIKQDEAAAAARQRWLGGFYQLKDS